MFTTAGLLSNRVRSLCGSYSRSKSQAGLKPCVTTGFVLPGTLLLACAFGWACDPAQLAAAGLDISSHVVLAPFLNMPAGMERVLQALGWAEVHPFMQSELFAQSLCVLLPTVKVCFCYSLQCTGSHCAAVQELFANLAMPVCTAFSASLRCLSWEICFLFNNKKVLLQCWVTADASARSAISAAPLALFTLIRPTLELFQAEDLMSPLIRKWHPLWIRLAAWKVKNCQWLQK